MSLAVVLLQILACLGAGALLLRALGLMDVLPVRERPLWAFTLGFGLLGWLVFPLALAGLVGTGPLLLLEGAMALGSVLFWPDLRRIARPKPSQWGWAEWGLAGVALAAVVFDSAEALAPPLDADTLAYHFARPLEIVRTGRIEFVPRAGDGAGAYLAHMPYVASLALGGEQALTLWCMTSGWAGPLFLYVVARRWLAPHWSAALALILATTPAWIYGAGSGQVEARLALYAFGGLLAAAEARRTGVLPFALLAGLMAGFYGGSKYLGLFFVVAAGLVVVWQRRPWRLALAFAAAALLAGFQWYAWNYVESGDPVFPGLFRLLGVRDPDFWNADIDAFLHATTLAGERPGSPAIFWLFLYPFAAGAGLGNTIWEAGRTGLGPFALLVLPFVFGGLWMFRDRLRTSPLFGIALGILFFYVLWFLIGPSQRIRHLLPLWPAFLLCVAVTAERWSAAVGQIRFLASAVIIALALQIAGQTLFTLPYLRYATSGEDRAAFLVRRVIAYSVVPWLNAHLAAGDRVLTMERQLNYYLEKPAFYLLAGTRARPDLRDQSRDVRRQWTDLRHLGITHVLLIPGLGEPSPGSSLWRLGRELVAAGCAEVAVTIPARLFLSRTLPSFGAHEVPADVLKLRPARCDPERLPRE